MAKIRDVIQFLEEQAPPALQESYDNAGLILGNRDWEVKGVLVALDALESIVDEAITKGCNMIVAHHPIIFRGLKSLTGKNYVERTVIKAIKNDIAIYAAHTNLDNVATGVNHKICNILGLQNLKILAPKKGTLKKLVVFVPHENTQEVLNALYQAGAGEIGNYENCSFRVTGTGTFTPNDQANPHIGEKLQPEEVTEHRIEIIFPAYREAAVISALLKAHPYEEVAHYLHSLDNKDLSVGSGMIGNLPQAMNTEDFLNFLKEKMELNCIRHTTVITAKVERIAVCGGSGSFLLPKAIQGGADVFVTADLKYHEFFDADQQLVIADIGHYESERFTKDLIFGLIKDKFSTFAVNFSDIATNPIQYF